MLHRTPSCGWARRHPSAATSAVGSRGAKTYTAFDLDRSLCAVYVITYQRYIKDYHVSPRCIAMASSASQVYGNVHSHISQDVTIVENVESNGGNGVVRWSLYLR